MAQTAERVLVALSIALLLLSTVPADVAATAPTTVRDGDFIFQGEKAQTPQMFNDTLPVELYTSGGSHVRNYTSSGGVVTFDTDSFSGDYYFAQNGTKEMSFEVRERSIEATFEGIKVSNGGNVETAVVTFGTNAGYGEIVVSSVDIPNLGDRTSKLERVDGSLVGEVNDAGKLTLEIDVSNLDEGTYKIRGENGGEVLGDADAWIEITPESEQSAPPNAVTKTLQNGSSYWVSTNLLFTYGPNSEFAIGTEGNAVLDGKMNSSGEFMLKSGGWDPGAYTITSDGDQVLTFKLRAQGLSASAANQTVNVSSNRAGYDLAVWGETLNRSQLLDVFPTATVTESGDVVIGNVPANASLDANTDALNTGNYTIHVTAHDTQAEATATLEVLESETSTVNESSGALNTTSTTTATAAPISTPTGETSTRTATATGTATVATSTTTGGGGVSATDAGAAGALVVGVGGAALLAKRR